MKMERRQKTSPRLRNTREVPNKKGRYQSETAGREDDCREPCTTKVREVANARTNIECWQDW